MTHQQTSTAQVSIHAPWEGCDGYLTTTHAVKERFQFTHPGKGATMPTLSRVRVSVSFNSRTLGRVRRTSPSDSTMSRSFQFTHPGKGATPLHLDDLEFLQVSIHAPWEGCDLPRHRGKLLEGVVSIHAPWEGCDSTADVISCSQLRFNSRTLGRVRLSAPELFYFDIQFQFTHPEKGATVSGIKDPIQLSGFNSRTLGRVRLVREIAQRLNVLVSIHAPWEGCDSLAVSQ